MAEYQDEKLSFGIHMDRCMNIIECLFHFLLIHLAVKITKPILK